MLLYSHGLVSSVSIEALVVAALLLSSWLSYLDCEFFVVELTQMENKTSTDRQTIWKQAKQKNTETEHVWKHRKTTKASIVGWELLEVLHPAMLG